MTDDIVRARTIISGRVQGVYFRQSTAFQARAAGVAGWVRNLEDGHVEAAFEGSHAAVDSMLRYVAVGPQHARVDAVETVWEPTAAEFGFSIR